MASKVRGLQGVAEVEVEYAEMSQAERSELMQRARRHAAEHAPPTAVRATTHVIAVASGKGGVGKSSVTVNLAAALAERGLRVGVLDADVWGFSVPRLLGVASRLKAKKIDDKSMILPEELKVGSGVVRVVSMGLLVDDEDTALMWRGLVLAKAFEEFLTKVDWGELDYLLLDMPPGTGDIQMALARMLPQSELLVVTTPAKNAQKVAARVTDMARRSYLKVLGVVENMSAFVAPDGTRHEIFGRGGGAKLAALTGAPLVAQIPVEPEVSTSGDEGRPLVTAAPDSPAAQAIRALAERIATELLPPVEMAGCTARLDDVFAKLQAKTARTDRRPRARGQAERGGARRRRERVGRPAPPTVAASSARDGFHGSVPQATLVEQLGRLHEQHAGEGAAHPQRGRDLVALPLPHGRLTHPHLRSQRSLRHEQRPPVRPDALPQRETVPAHTRHSRSATRSTQAMLSPSQPVPAPRYSRF